MALQSVSNVLLKPTEKLTIKLSVSLLTKEDNSGYYNIYEKYDKGYMIVDISSVVRLEYKDAPGTAWSRDQWVYITNNNIYQLIRGFDEMKNIFDTEAMYREDSSGQLEIISDIEDFIVTIDNLGNGSCIKLIPGVVYDRREKSLMGIHMHLNHMANSIDLSIDEFESMWYLFKNFNFRLETQSLLNLTLLEQIKSGVGNSATATNKNIDDTKKQLREHLNSAGATSIFDLVNKKDHNPKDDEQVSGGRITKEVPQSLDDL